MPVCNLETDTEVASTITFPQQDARQEPQSNLQSIERNRRSHARLQSLLIFAFLLGLALVQQWHARAFYSEFGWHPDESAHYITGLMVHDYIAAHHFSSPVAYAENYYLHYPKVALGHWPPFFYALEGAWMLAFSTSRFSMLFLMTCTTALLGFLVWRSLRDRVPAAMALVAGLAVVTSSEIQINSSMLMSDMLVALLCLAAALTFAQYLKTEESGWAVLFGVLSALAFLTKASAICLALVPLAAIAGARKWHLLRRGSLWSSALIIVVACGPWYARMNHGNQSTMAQPVITPDYFFHAAAFYGIGLAKIAGVAFPALFLATLSWDEEFSAIDRGLAWSLAGLIGGVILTVLLIPAALERRYLLPAIPALVILLCYGCASLRRRAAMIRVRNRIPAVVARLAIAAIFIAAVVLAPVKGVGGFDQVARRILADARFHDSISLVASDAVGEGMFVSDVGMDDKQRPEHIVLRGSKMLADVAWIGRDYRSLFDSPEELLSYLDSVPVVLVVSDHSMPEHLYLPHEKLLDQAIQKYPSRWRLLSESSVWRDGVEYPKALRLYELLGNEGQPHRTIILDMKRMLQRKLQLRGDRD